MIATTYAPGLSPFHLLCNPLQGVIGDIASSTPPIDFLLFPQPPGASPKHYRTKPTSAQQQFSLWPADKHHHHRCCYYYYYYYPTLHYTSIFPLPRKKRKR